jgi:hypothetical protein
MQDQEPCCDYRVTVRVELSNQPGHFARLAAAIAEEKASLGAIDIVEARRDKKSSTRYLGAAQTVADHLVLKPGGIFARAFSWLRL